MLTESYVLDQYQRIQDHWIAANASIDCVRLQLPRQTWWKTRWTPLCSWQPTEP
jgi:hypothetical protein